MKKLKLYINSLFIFSFLFSCNKYNGQKNNKLETIDLDIGLNNQKEIFLSQLASNIQYIPLETKDESFISEVTQIFTFKDKVIIYDRSLQSVLLFRQSGKFIKKIGNQGRGPGEYIETLRVNFNEKDSTIVVKDYGFNFYGIDGHFIKRELIFPIMGQISFMDDNIVLSFSRPDFVYNNGFQIAICDKEFNVKNRFVNRTNEGITIGNASKIMGNMLNCLQYFNDTLSFWEYKYDTIYRIPDIGTCFPRYAFKYNKKQKFDKGTKDKEEDNLRAIERMIETNNYIFLKLYNPSNTRFFNEMIYLKKTKEIISLKSHDNVSGILNDIDGGIEVLPRKVLKDGRLYTSFSAFKLKQLLRENPYKSIKPVNSEKHRDLIGLINNSKMQDNPIIMIITLK